MGSDPNHYSYAAYADPAMASSFDAARFGGPIGQILLEDQQRVLFEMLGGVKGLEILDVGTGTGRAAMALAGRGAVVTGVDASDEMLQVARRRSSGAGLAIEFTHADAHHLPYGDRSYDAAVCFRLLMHVPDWHGALGEICRVSRRRIVIDYPAAFSAASLQAGWRRIAISLGRQVEAYRVFSHHAVEDQLARHQFRVVSIHRQFVLPIGLHKLAGSPGVTRAVESGLASIGLLRLAGSPVTIAAERCGS
jgi:SAM-dependent methyltransferase